MAFSALNFAHRAFVAFEILALAAACGNMRDDPIVYAAGDWVTWLVCAASLAVLLTAKSLTFH